ncbi:unnamed protein product [Parnassius apollo]|uniref:(apollo) hypothetical protein n=1 Tax=Parnassius apollo TaxID=110799 RepID=A0A8S3XWS0_PARAO|nr:unnamed protein product [Parnassius apollo]
MVRADLTLRHIKTQRPRRNFVGKLSIQNLKEAANKLTERCADFEKETKNLDIQQKCDWFETSIKLAKSTCTNKEKKKSYLSIKTKNLLEARKQVISSRDTENHRKRISELSKDIKQSMRRDRKQNRRKKIEEQIIRTGGTKKAYKELSESKDWVTKVRNEKGIEQNRRSDIKDIATSYYKQLYENTQEEPGKLIVLNDVEDESIPYILQREVEVALQSQSKHKAPRPDGIENEILLMAKNVLLPIITKL